MTLSDKFLIVCLILLILSKRASAFGAGNIPSIAQVEGHNWRHGDIEDVLATIAFLHGKKWTSKLIKKVYFGNWLRDYSQAVDVGSLKGVNAETIRILVWVLSFMAFGYATEEFEVTSARLGVYRPEEHIDNPLGYADGLDARTYDPRLRGPVEPVETQIDMRTGMKNYICNEQGNWATSAGYLRWSFARSIHYGRVYMHGPSGSSGKKDDLYEALRCLGQALHCMEDFSAHSNYCELALRELGHRDVYPHCGTHTEINVHGKRLYPLTTGTFGAVDFLHSVIGEATDHFTQSEVDQMNSALQNAEGITTNAISSATGSNTRGLPGMSKLPFSFGSSSSSSGGTDFISLLAKIPGGGSNYASEAKSLRDRSEAQERENLRAEATVAQNPHQNQNQVPGMNPNFDPVKVAGQIYPILEFRDRIVRAISSTVSKIPGLEKLLEHISETLTAFIMGLLAPFIRPIIKQVSKVLKQGSSQVISSSARSQFEPWTNPQCSDPTHSMLSKDHFTNILNSCAGRVAATILQYVVPRILYAWEHPGVPVDEVVNDVLRAFHHPALRDERIQIQNDMFNTVRKWADEHPKRHQLNHLLGSQSVKDGKNHILQGQAGQHGGNHTHTHSHGGTKPLSKLELLGQMGHGKVAGSLWSQVRTRDINDPSGPDDDYEVGPYQPPSPGRTPSPASLGAGRPPSSGNDYGYNPSGRPQSSDGHLMPGKGHGAASSYYSASTPQPPPQYQGYQGPPPPQGAGYDYYHQPPPQWGSGPPSGPPPPQWGSQSGPPPPQWGVPAPQWGAQPPSQYGQPQYLQSQGQYPLQHEQPPPPNWGQYPGAGHH